MCDSFTDWGKVDNKVDKLLLVKPNKKVDELIMLECARSPHVAIFENELFNKTLEAIMPTFHCITVKCSYITYYYIISL